MEKSEWRKTLLRTANGIFFLIVKSTKIRKNYNMILLKIENEGIDVRDRGEFYQRADSEKNQK